MAEQLLVTRAQTRLARAKGDHHRAWAFGDQGLSSAHSSGAQLLVVDFLELLAMLAADGDRFLDAARLLAATAKERERLGYVRFLVEQRDIDLAKSQIEAALGPNGLAAALSEGASLSIDEAVGYARRGRGRRGRPRFGSASLTPTERRVVSLVVDGLTNAEIGEQMFVSSPTIKSHLTHIFAKLGVSNRRQLASAAKAVIV